MYEHYCRHCRRIWFSHDPDPQECLYCHAEQKITPSEYPGYVQVVIQTSYID
jgi:hypothetical protein